MYGDSKFFTFHTSLFHFFVVSLPHIIIIFKLTINIRL
jgi:hypothetical protein